MSHLPPWIGMNVLLLVHLGSNVSSPAANKFL